VQEVVFILLLLKVCYAYIFVYPCVEKEGEFEASALFLHIGNYLMQILARCPVIMSWLLMILLSRFKMMGFASN
jgi:hypothetical protein